jgi:type VI secretion system FHA domain protein
VPAAPAGDESGAGLAALLAGAGLTGVSPTPELARSFGQIFRVVVSGVMDVLRSRQQIKDEFRMRMTQFRPADNNPLKFSANVDDALHNLLVKRNPAYLEPVEAFEDAFEDLRNHQLAMLAGMRVAYEAMLAEFDADRLEQQFDRQLKRVPLLKSVTRLRYWDLYRDRRDEMAKDADASFRQLFGEVFARAYEEQLTRLKAESRAREGASKPSRPPRT